MAMTITVAITVADDQPYTGREAAVIAAMQAHPSNGTRAVATEISAPAVAEEKPAAPTKPAAKPATKPAAGRRVPDPDAGDVILAKAAADLKATQAAEEAQREAESAAAVRGEGVDFAALEAEMAAEATDAPTMEDAVTKATEAISAGKQAQVKAALTGAGVKRVSELKGAAIATFLTALGE